jgi:hypothetical protein
MEPSLRVSSGLFVNIRANWDAQRLSPEALSEAVDEYLKQALLGLSLTTVDVQR